MPTTIAPVSKTAQVLKFCAQQYGGKGVPRTRLGKFAFMADVIARQYLGHAITDLEYRKDHYGPYARELPEYTQELVAAELADETKLRDGNVRTIRLHDSGIPISFDFTLGEAEVLGYVMERYPDMDFEEFVLHVVKETDPFKAVRRQDELLPMGMLDNVVKRTAGFDLESIIRAERQAEAGEFVTLEQFADELHSHYPT